ncbi:MAG: DNA-processing protein DprA [Alphaproteobacteria bacterium]
MTGDLFARPSGAIRLTDAQRLDWLRLVRSENVGPRTFRELVNFYGGAGAALEALPGLSARGGSRSIRIASEADARREIEAASRYGVRFVALGEADYPDRLRAMSSSPPLLALRGTRDVLGKPMVAMVGARNASLAGVKMATRLARDLGEAGYCVVSGLARGIDAAAHEASLAFGTVAVLAGGHDRIYPPENVPLLERLIEANIAVSEMPMGHEPRAKDFPRRNRLIAGLSLGVVVIEAAERSGSLITARIALEENREVFAVPGSPLDPRCEGSNRLLKQGAILVTDVGDIDAVLQPILGRPPPPPAAEEPGDEGWLGAAPDASARSRVLTLLGPTPVSLDELVRHTGLSAATVRVLILELELAGRIERDSGGRIALIA